MPGNEIQDHLRRWTTLFGRSQLLVLSHDELLSDVEKVQWRIQEFLGGGDDTAFSGALLAPQGRGRQRRVTELANNILGPAFEEKNQELYDFLEEYKGPPMEQVPFPRFTPLIKKVEEDSKKKIVLPNVLLIGAEQAGTSSIADWLFEAEVCRPKRFDGEPFYYDKEVHFFDDSTRYKEGLAFYSKRFEHCVNDEMIQWIMDASPETIMHPDKVHEIYSQAPGDMISNLKLIYIVREPISRELSHYNQMKQEFLATNDMNDKWFSNVAFGNGTVMTFDQYASIVLEPNIFKKEWIWPSKYVDALKKWNDLFGRNNLLVLNFNELQEDPQKVQWRVRNFLGGKFPGKLSESTDNFKGMTEGAKCALGPKFALKNDELYKFL